jgi:NAD(P) transhydrogenase subunit beta
MPILEAEKAKNVIICNLDEKPGYSGVDNLLYKMSHVITIWGNAAETIPQLTTEVKE